MGELYLCTCPQAAVPFRVEGLQLNIYSMEELSYYIMHNTFLLDHSFMSMELCTWLDKQMGQTELAATLKELVINRGRLSDFVRKIVENAGYCSREEVREILYVIHQMETKSEFECGKIRADKLLEGGRYIHSIYEYRRLLESDDATGQNKILLGNIWHNLGTCYGRLFLYREAVSCYRQAYRQNGKLESLKELLYACLGMEEKDDATFNQVVQEYRIDAASAAGVKSTWKSAGNSKEMKEFIKELNQMQEIRDDYYPDYEEIAAEILNDWKMSYRRVCGS